MRGDHQKMNQMYGTGKSDQNQQEIHHQDYENMPSNDAPDDINEEEDGNVEYEQENSRKTHHKNSDIS